MSFSILYELHYHDLYFIFRLSFYYPPSRTSFNVHLSFSTHWYRIFPDRCHTYYCTSSLYNYLPCHSLSGLKDPTSHVVFVKEPEEYTQLLSHVSDSFLPPPSSFGRYFRESRKNVHPKHFT